MKTPWHSGQSRQSGQPGNLHRAHSAQAATRDAQQTVGRVENGCALRLTRRYGETVARFSLEFEPNFAFSSDTKSAFGINDSDRLATSAAICTITVPARRRGWLPVESTVPPTVAVRRPLRCGGVL